MAAISLQQNIVRVVQLEVVQGGPLNTLVPNTCFQVHDRSFREN